MQGQNRRGAFTTLMTEHPDIKEMVLRLHREQSPKMPIKSIHRRMLSELCFKGLQESDYPFNTYGLGLNALRHFLKKSDDFICYGPKTTRKTSESASPAVPLDQELAVVRIVRGNLKRGIRPHVNFTGVRYQGSDLSRTPSLVGQKVFLAVNPNDIRTITAYSMKGHFLDNLTNGELRCSHHPVTLEDHRRGMQEKHRMRWDDMGPIDLFKALNSQKDKGLGDKTDDQRPDDSID